MVESYTGLLYKVYIDGTATNSLSTTNGNIILDSSNMAYFGLKINKKWGLLKFDPINQATSPFTPIYYVRPTSTYSDTLKYENVNVMFFNSDQSRIFVGGAIL